MSQTFTFYTFNKKKNSTKVPSYSSTNPKIYCEFKGPYNMHTPKIILDFSAYSPIPSLFNYNYCSTVISGETYYYFIRMKTMLATKAIAEFELELDYMATFKNSIGNSYAFLEYTETNPDTRIPDNRMVYTTDYLYNMTWDDYDIFTNLGRTYDDANPMIVMQVMSGNMSASTLATDLYFLNVAKLADFYNWINGNSPIEQLIGKYITHVQDCIVNLIALPIRLNNVPDGYWEYIEVLGQTSTVEAVQTDKSSVAWPLHLSKTISLNIPKVFNDWRDANATYMIHLPYYGKVELPADYMASHSTVSVSTELIISSGKLKYMVHHGTYIIGEYTTNCSIPVPISKIDKIDSMWNGLNAFIGSSVSIASNGMNPAALPNIMSDGIAGVSNIVSASRLSPTVSGTSGNTDDWNTEFKKIYITATSRDTDFDPEDYASYLGRPLHKVQLISTHTGYIQTRDFHFEYGDVTTKAAIESICNGGFYYE